MTAIGKRDTMGGGGDIVGVHSVRQFVMAVPDQHGAGRFHAGFGLAMRRPTVVIAD